MVALGQALALLHVQANAEAVHPAGGVVQAGIDAGGVRRALGDRRRVHIGDIVDLAEQLPIFSQINSAADSQVECARNEVVVDGGVVGGRQRAAAADALNILPVK